MKRCKDCDHCSIDIEFKDMHICNNKEDFVQVFTNEGATISVDPEFCCNGYKEICK